MTHVSTPFGNGSVSYKAYVCGGSARERIDDFMTQARLADAHGFDGLVVSEHHLGFPGYLPNPMQAVTWALDATSKLWAAPCPLLILLRPTALVAEELAWLAARHPMRVGAGVAAGAIARDFDLAGTDMHDLVARYREALAQLTSILHGADPGPLDGDPAIADLAAEPVPVVSAASSSVACRRAAEVGCGIVLESHTSVEYLRRFIDVYRDHGGRGPCVLNRRVWVGDPPPGLAHEQVALYRNTVPDYDRRAWMAPDDMVVHGDPARIADRLRTIMTECGATALTLRVHVNGVYARDVHEQVALVGDRVLPALRDG